MADKQKSFEIVARLTESSLPINERQIALRDFAQTNGWRPSDLLIEHPESTELANGHLIVEHGLDNTAVISFLKADNSFYMLNYAEKLSLLSISYNNLVDWHFFPDKNGLTFVYNLTKPAFQGHLSIHEDPDIWRAEAFDKLTGKRPNPNIKSLDDALIQTLSLWKRLLAAELGVQIKNEDLSVLFNTIILIRALEDHKKWQNGISQKLLCEVWENDSNKLQTLEKCFKKCLLTLGLKKWPSQFLDREKLKKFDKLDKETTRELLYDFYNNRFAPYQYDFFLMSKHALSRIYEHYTTLLREEDSPQLRLFKGLPHEVKDYTLGGIYTPQYIARFFSRFLRENLTPRNFRDIKTADPACGSGIFLRTLLEMQCDPVQDIDLKTVTNKAFNNIFGLDVDLNACQASSLSLSLLHLAITGDLPKDLNIKNAELIEYYKKNSKLHEYFDAIITNPPFIKWASIPNEWKKRIQNFVEKDVEGKPDMYLAYLKAGMQMLKPGGFLLFVLPHSFLIANNSSNLRQVISNKFLVRLLADLSNIPVFEEVGSYVILLVIQKKTNHIYEAPNATIVRCREFPGLALQEALEGKLVKTDFYSVFELNQSTFNKKEWHLLPPEKEKLNAKIKQFPSLDEFLIVREGFITGADDIFIRSIKEIPEEERNIYVPYLSDRKMQRYLVPRQSDYAVFYPYIENKKLSKEELQDSYPKTWEHLNLHSSILKSRKSVKSGEASWWSPVRPRLPENLLRPKIITPHLILLPRFSLDASGKYAISHSPLMYPKESGAELELLVYFLAVLNSSVSFWQIMNLSHKYRHGYAMLEPKTLKMMNIPDPSKIPSSAMMNIQSLVNERINKPSKAEIESEIDLIVADLYGLSKSEQKEIGIDK